MRQADPGGWWRVTIYEGCEAERRRYVLFATVAEARKYARGRGWGQGQADAAVELCELPQVYETAAECIEVEEAARDRYRRTCSKCHTVCEKTTTQPSDHSPQKLCPGCLVAYESSLVDDRERAASARARGALR